MNSQDLIRKLRQYPVASIATSVSIILILALYFRSMSFPAVEERYQRADRSWKAVEDNVFKNSVNLETHLEMAKTITDDVRERLIRPSELASNYQYFYRLESATGVRILSLQQQAPPPPPPPAAPARGAAAAPPPPPPLFSNVGYAMTVTGTYPRMLELLGSLERGQHFYHLKSFSLQRSDETEARAVTVTMNFDLLGTP